MVEMVPNTLALPREQWGWYSQIWAGSSVAAPNFFLPPCLQRPPKAGGNPSVHTLQTCET